MIKPDLAPGHAQAADELLEFSLFLVKTSQRFLAIFLEGRVTCGRTLIAEGIAGRVPQVEARARSHAARAHSGSVHAHHEKHARDTDRHEQKHHWREEKERKERKEMQWPKERKEMRWPKGPHGTAPY